MPHWTEIPALPPADRNRTASVSPMLANNATGSREYPNIRSLETKSSQNGEVHTDSIRKSFRSISSAAATEAAALRPLDSSAPDR